MPIAKILRKCQMPVADLIARVSHAWEMDKLFQATHGLPMSNCCKLEEEAAAAQHVHDENALQQEVKQEEVKQEVKHELGNEDELDVDVKSEPDDAKDAVGCGEVASAPQQSDDVDDKPLTDVFMVVLRL